MRKLFPARTFTVLYRTITTKPLIRQEHATISHQQPVATRPSKPLYIDHEPSKNHKIYVAMSGGVDSSTATALLKQKGYDLHGVFMRNWTDDNKNTPCRSETDWKDVQDVCQHLSIPCERIDLSREYWMEVFQPALDVYAMGETPNPDIACNREIKFGKLFERLKERGQGQNWWLATGHYARSAVNTVTGRSVLLRSKDPNKDQTFYLSQISQSSLSRTLFPLWKYTKPEIRSLAKSLLPPHIAEKPDSQGLCFVEPSLGRHFSTFLKDYLPPTEPAEVVLENGKVVGEHKSIWSVTIGERSRLNFKESQKLNPGGQWYVAEKKIGTSPTRYIIVPGNNHPRLFSKGLVARDWKWIDEEEDWTQEGMVSQVRHRQKPVKCRLDVKGQRVKVEFEGEDVYGVTPGQAVAVWLEERCLGGGIIETAY